MTLASRQRVLFAYAALLLAAFALRLWQLGTQSLWHDEGWSLYPAYTLLGQMGIRGMDVNAPPLFNISIGLWLRAVGDAVWTVRLWSALTGVIGVACGIWLARRWFGAWAGALAGVFLAFSPILWVFAQEIRAYIPMPIYTVLLIALAAEFLVPRKQRVPNRAWWWLFAVTLAALWSHNLSVPLVAWLNVTVIGGLLLRGAWRRLRGWLLLQSLLFALYLPWLLTQRPTGTPLNTPPSLSLDLLWQIWQAYFTGIKALVGADDALMLLCALFGALAAFSLFRAVWLWRSARLWVLLSAVLLLPVFQLLIILAAHIDFHPRYFLLSAPPTLILMAAGLAKGKLPLALPALRLAAALLAVAIMGRMAWLTYSTPIYQHDDFRGMAQHYTTLTEDAAIVIPYGWEPSLDYYAEKLGVRAPFVEVPIYSSAERLRMQLAEGLQGKRSADVFTWYQLPADLRGAFPCLLGAVGNHVGELTLSGVRTDHYALLASDVLAAPTLPQTSGEASHFDLPDGGLGFRRTAFLHTSGNDHACLILDFYRDSVPLNEDWRIAVRLMDGNGGIYAAVDADLRDDRQRTAAGQGDYGFQATAFLALDVPRKAEAWALTAWLYKGDQRSAAQLLGTLTAEAGVARFAPNTDALPRVFVPPRLPIRVDSAPFRVQVRRDEWRAVGALAAADLAETFSAEAPPDLVTLLWRAESPLPVSYLVFVHLVAPDGRLLAQSDSEPMDGARPTSSWRTGEYVQDRHALSWHVKDYRGEAAVRVGIYDLRTGARLTLADGSDFVTLPRKVIVE
jgi:4-amino-4-deoxy-L-arabinose transferase-like glycosyltransferase